MERIKFLFRKVFSWNYKEAFRQAGILSKKYGGNRFLIFIDMIICGIKYGAGYVDYVEFEFNLLNSKQRKTYLTSELNNRIVKKYNQKEYWDLFNDKIVFNKYFEKYLKRDYISIRDNDSTFDEFVSFCKKHKTIVAKAVDQTHGMGIDFYDIDNKTDFKKLYTTLRESGQYLIEEKIVQCEELNKLFPKSVNTLRVISFLTDDNEVVIIRSVLKIGTRDGIDNCRNGGMYTFLDDDGKVILPAFDENNVIYENHPITGEKIVGFQVPHYNELKELINEVGKVIPQVRYVGWDVAITDKGLAIVEGNEYSGIFQMKASMNPTKQGDLPRFQKYMEF